MKMNFSSFFIDRPIFASVIALFITLLGVFAYPVLPLSQYPEIAPPSVAIVAAFPGASAETMAETIAAPIEQEVNGADGMLYMRSNSSQGLTTITVTFQPGTDIDMAQVLVQNRVAIAEPRLPDQVRQIGVTVTKQATDFLMVAAMTTTDPAIDIDYVGNYANSTIRDRLLRIPGVGAVQVFGAGNYSMRIWIDLAAKNAILIVEFARQAEDDQGMSRFDAAVHAAKSRLRPILMTSFAFIFGVIPLAIAVGPGAEMRQARGTAVAFGMVGVTLFGLIFTPVFYVVCRWLDRFMPKAMQHSTLHAHGHPEAAQ